jgi:hypothetical protein
MTHTDVVKHSSLYNGLSGGTIYGDIWPAAPGYVFDNFWTDYDGARKDGIMTASLKVVRHLLAQ